MPWRDRLQEWSRDLKKWCEEKNGTGDVQASETAGEVKTGESEVSHPHVPASQ